MIIKTRKQILAEMIQWARNNNSSLTDFNQGSVIRSIFNAVAAILAQLYYNIHQTFRSARIIYATGTDLEIAVASRSMTRQGATKAVGVATFGGTSGTVIPLGMKVATEDGIGFVTKGPATMPAIGSVEIDIEAVTAGEAGKVSALAINILVDQIDGLVSVSNPAYTDGGFDYETDEQLRNRAITQLATLSQGIQASYEAWAREARTDIMRAKAQFGHPSYSDKTVVVYLVKNNGGNYTGTERLSVEHYIQTKAPLGVLIKCLNIDWASIDLVAQVRLAAGFDLTTVRANITINMRLYLDYREWEWGTDIDWSDLYSLVNSTLGVDEISLSQFAPSSNVAVGEYSLPKFTSLVVTDW